MISIFSQGVTIVSSEEDHLSGSQMTSWYSSTWFSPVSVHAHDAFLLMFLPPVCPVCPTGSHLSGSTGSPLCKHLQGINKPKTQLAFNYSALARFSVVGTRLRNVFGIAWVKAFYSFEPTCSPLTACPALARLHPPCKHFTSSLSFF